jgi:hypothetical protein
VEIAQKDWTVAPTPTQNKCAERAYGLHEKIEEDVKAKFRLL